jgi:hypothetical protein
VPCCARIGELVKRSPIVANFCERNIAGANRGESYFASLQLRRLSSYTLLCWTMSGQDITHFTSVDHTSDPAFFRNFLDQANKIPAVPNGSSLLWTASDSDQA